MSTDIVGAASATVNPAPEPPLFRVGDGTRFYEVHGPDIKGSGHLWATCRSQAAAKLVAEALDAFFAHPESRS